MPEQAAFNRRAFLARIGVLGAAVGAGSWLGRRVPFLDPAGPGAATGIGSPAATPPGGVVLQALVNALRPVLDALALDTFRGMVVFALPGPDPYSAIQGTPRSEPGAIESRGAEFLVQALDEFVPFPDQLARPLAAAFSTALADVGIGLPNPLGLLSGQLVSNLDQALAVLLQNDQTIPLSLAVALMLNLLATQVRPTAVTGPLGSPFARLSFAEKAQVFKLVEGTDANLVAKLDISLPAPLHGSVSGLLEFLGGSLLEFAAFGSANEWGVFNPATRQVTARPVGWQLSGYKPKQLNGYPVNGLGDGWDEFRGYYGGRRSVADV